MADSHALAVNDMDKGVSGAVDHVPRDLGREWAVDENTGSSDTLDDVVLNVDWPWP